MQFDCGGTRWDIAEMRIFITGDSTRPFVYLSPDGACVFVAERSREDEVSFRPSTRAEAMLLAQRYRIPGLQQMLEQGNASLTQR